MDILDGFTPAPLLHCSVYISLHVMTYIRIFWTDLLLPLYDSFVAEITSSYINERLYPMWNRVGLRFAATPNINSLSTHSCRPTRALEIMRMKRNSSSASRLLQSVFHDSALWVQNDKITTPINIHHLDVPKVTCIIHVIFIVSRSWGVLVYSYNPSFHRGLIMVVLV